MKNFGITIIALTALTLVSNVEARVAKNGSAERVMYNASGMPMLPGQLIPSTGGTAKITCPCSCNCPKNSDGKCPTECLIGKKDGSSTPKGL